MILLVCSSMVYYNIIFALFHFIFFNATSHAFQPEVSLGPRIDLFLQINTFLFFFPLHLWVSSSGYWGCFTHPMLNAKSLSQGWNSGHCHNRSCFLQSLLISPPHPENNLLTKSPLCPLGNSAPQLTTDTGSPTWNSVNAPFMEEKH